MDRQTSLRATRCRVGPLAFGMIASLVVLSLSGCKHHRSALRPVYAVPEPAVMVPADPCPSVGCPDAGGIDAGFDEGYLTPAPAVLPPVGSSAIPQTDGEPYLDPGVLPETRSIQPTTRGPDLNPPQETRRSDPSRRATRLSRVRKFVNDPRDFYQPPKADRAWQYIVLHHSDNPTGSYGEIDRLHREQLGTTGCGYHFVIGNGTLSPDGQIEVTQRWSDQKAGAHCRDARTAAVNDYGIGICLVGDLDTSPPTPRQIEAAQALVAYLEDRYAIPTERAGSHAQLASNPTACPGKYFPAEAILGNRHLASR